MADSAPCAGMCEAVYCDGNLRCRKNTLCRGHWLRLWGLAQSVPGYDKSAWIAVDKDLVTAGALCSGAVTGSGVSIAFAAEE